MKVILAACLLLGVVAQFSNVDAVKCNDLSTCIKTDFTTATCEKNVCKCAAGYVATDEGCIKKPAKPTVTLSGVNNAEALKDAQITLTCTSGEAFSTSTYKWYVDEKEDKTTTKTLTVQMAEKDIKFQCAVVTRTATSDKSDVKTVKYLKSGGSSDAEPVVTLPSPGVADKRQFTPVCTGYPYGLVAAEVQLLDKDDKPLTVPVTQDAAVKDNKIKCKFVKADYTFNKDKTIDFPKVITTFSNVAVLPAYAGPMAFTVTNAPTLTCQIFPSEEYLPDGAAITYEWSTKGDKKDFEVPKKAGEFDKVTCTAKLDETKLTSKALPKITIKDDYLAEPTVTPMPKKPFKTSQVALTCTTKEKDVTFTWAKNKVAIAGQVDKTIQFGDIAADFADEFTCVISKNGFDKASKPYTVKVQDAPAKPVVSGKQEVGKWGKLELTCQSDSAVPAMKYSWAKGGKAIAKATKPTYTVDDVENKSSGKYSCTTTFGKQTQKSDEVDVKVVAPGIVCAKDGDCDKKQKSLTGKCDTKTKRCVCASHYYARGNECGNGVGQMVASLGFVMMAALISRLL